MEPCLDGIGMSLRSTGDRDTGRSGGIHGRQQDVRMEGCVESSKVDLSGIMDRVADSSNLLHGALCHPVLDYIWGRTSGITLSARSKSTNLELTFLSISFSALAKASISAATLCGVMKGEKF